MIKIKTKHNSTLQDYSHIEWTISEPEDPLLAAMQVKPFGATCSGAQ
jgi:hypothetical protein